MDYVHNLIVVFLNTISLPRLSIPFVISCLTTSACWLRRPQLRGRQNQLSEVLGSKHGI